MAKGKIDVKVVKGTRDWRGAELILRDRIFAKVSEVFRRHGGEPLDTPVFELKDVLSGKYGEDSKLIYDLADQGGELLSLRYDLTVPFARWVALNGIQNVKRYQIAKVYRRDQPAIARGRMREFYQCDFDIAGVYEPMIPDAELVAIIVEAFRALDLGNDIRVKINHRCILDGLFAVCGVPQDKIRTTSSAVDKLDKAPWAVVKKEMVEEKGLPEEVADKIGKYVVQSGTLAAMVETLKADADLNANETFAKGLSDMALLQTYLEAFGVTDSISFDMSLARGLDYYTGLIYEVVIDSKPATNGQTNGEGKSEGKSKSKSKSEDEPQVGSIAAGGRYDDLVSMFGKSIPCVGVSFGCDRIFTILKDRAAKSGNKGLKPKQVDAYILAFGGGNFNGALPERMAVARDLWSAGISAEFVMKAKARSQAQFKAAETAGAAVGVILGEDEIARGEVRVKLMGFGATGEDKEGKCVKREEVATEVRRLLDKVAADEAAGVTQGVEEVKLA